MQAPRHLWEVSTAQQEYTLIDAIGDSSRDLLVRFLQCLKWLKLSYVASEAKYSNQWETFHVMHIKSCWIYINCLFDVFSFHQNPLSRRWQDRKAGSVEHSLKMKASCRDSTSGKCSKTEFWINQCGEQRGKKNPMYRVPVLRYQLLGILILYTNPHS